MGDNVHLNDEWYTLNSIIQNNKIIRIDKNYIIIKDLKTNQENKLKVYDDK